MNGPIRVEGAKRVKRGRSTRRYRRPPLIRPRSLIWLPVVGALIWGAYTYGTPHLRFVYSYRPGGTDRYYTRCDYVGLHSQRVIPFDGHCPLFLLLKPQKDD